MNINAAFPSRYLKAADLGAGRPVVVIAGVTMEEIGEEKLPVLSMVGKDKAIVLNRTNANMIAEIAGTTETEGWRGVKIQLYATKTDFGGKRVDCVRIEYPTPAVGTANLNGPKVVPVTTTTGQWSQVAAPAPFLPPMATVANGPALSDDDIPF